MATIHDPDPDLELAVAMSLYRVFHPSRRWDAATEDGKAKFIEAAKAAIAVSRLTLNLRHAQEVRSSAARWPAR